MLRKVGVFDAAAYQRGVFAVEMLLQRGDFFLQQIGFAEHGVVDPVVRKHRVEFGF